MLSPNTELFTEIKSRFRADLPAILWGADPMIFSPIKGTAQPSLKSIADAVARYFDIPAGAIKGEKRTKQLVRIRHLFCLLAYELTGKSQPVIGRFLGRDHSTVGYAIKSAREKVKADTDYRQSYETLRREAFNK